MAKADPEEQKLAKLLWEGTVGLDISTPDEGLTNEIYSYTSRELRSLGDVTIVDVNNALWTVTINAMESRYTDGTASRHVVMAVAVTQPATWHTLFKDKLDSRYYEVLRGLCSEVVDLEEMWVSACAREHLKSTCRNLVASFDGRILKPERERVRMLLERLKSDREKKPEDEQKE
jgi:hypothetical protein